MPTYTRPYTRSTSLVGTFVAVWLLIGLLAAWQRDYFEGRVTDECRRASTIAVTVIAGPLNYLGANPKVRNCALPEPSR
jgi:hypothetical protein